MSNTTLETAYLDLIAAGTSKSATPTNVIRSVADIRGSLGGFVTMKITNGPTGPTVPCRGRLYISHNPGATPSASGPGPEWKVIWEYNGGVSNSAETESGAIELPLGTQHIQVEYALNTGQVVTVEAQATIATSASTV